MRRSLSGAPSEIGHTFAWSVLLFQWLAAGQAPPANKIYILGDSQAKRVAGLGNIFALYDAEIEFFGNHSVPGGTPWQGGELVEDSKTKQLKFEPDVRTVAGFQKAILEDLSKLTARKAKTGFAIPKQWVVISTGLAVFDGLWVSGVEPPKKSIEDLANAIGAVANLVPFCKFVFVYNPKAAEYAQQGWDADVPKAGYKDAMDMFVRELRSSSVNVFEPMHQDMKDENGYFSDTHLGPISLGEFAGFIAAEVLGLPKLPQAPSTAGLATPSAARMHRRDGVGKEGNLASRLPGAGRTDRGNRWRSLQKAKQVETVRRRLKQLSAMRQRLRRERSREAAQ